jgi:hypothetical protein
MIRRQARRGNYAVIFALALTAILGFCALALDYSRIVISELQLQNTADASALAATTMLRDFDGDVLLARKSAEYIIGENYVAEKRGGISPEISFGKWDWSKPSSSAWSKVTGSSSPTAVWVRVERDSDAKNKGVPLWIAPAVGGPERADVEATAMAAYRSRETIVLVDVTRGSQYAMTSIQKSLGYYLEYLVALGVPGDQVGLAVFAADAAMVTPLSDVKTSLSSQHLSKWNGTAKDSVSTCRREGFNDWYFFDRFYGYRGTNMGVSEFSKTYPERVDYFYPLNWEKATQDEGYTYNAAYWSKSFAEQQIKLAELTGIGMFAVNIGGKKVAVDCTGITPSCSHYASFVLWKKDLTELFSPTDPFVPSHPSMPSCRKGTTLADSVEWTHPSAGCINAGDPFADGCPHPAYYDAGRKPSSAIKLALSEFNRYTTSQQALKHIILITAGLPECTFVDGMVKPVGTTVLNAPRDACTKAEQKQVMDLLGQGFDSDAVSTSIISINMNNDPDQSNFWAALSSGQGEFYETNTPSDIYIALDDLVKKVPVVLVQ